MTLAFEVRDAMPCLWLPSLMVICHIWRRCNRIMIVHLLSIVDVIMAHRQMRLGRFWAAQRAKGFNDFENYLKVASLSFQKCLSRLSPG